MRKQLFDLDIKTKSFLFAFIISFSFFLAILLTWNIFNFPLSRQGVDAKMSTHSVFAFQEEMGVLVYITQTEDSYVIHVFVPSIILNRYRLHIEREYTDNFVTAVPGRYRYFALELDDNSIKLVQSTTTRIQTNHVIASFIFIISATSLCYRVLLKYYFRKSTISKTF